MSTGEHANGNGHAGANGNGVAYGPSPIGRGLSDSLPPHNLEAERCVLGGCLLDNGAIEEVMEHLSADDFYREAHATAFRAMVALFVAGRPVDAVTLADELARRDQFKLLGGDEFLLEIAGSVPHAANVVYHAQIVRQKSISRQLILGFTENIRDGYSNLYTAQELYARALSRITPILDGQEDEEEIRLVPRPAPPGAAAWAGIAGDLVAAIEPKCESDMAALLIQFLVLFGNVVGHAPHAIVNRSRHHTNLYCCITGPSSVGRKGTGLDVLEWVLWHCDDEWASTRRFSGIASGEGLIEKVRDEYCDLQGKLFPGEPDKRAYWVESEFESVLAVAGRDHSVVTPKIRQLWDKCEAASQSKNNPSKTTNAHVSIIGHCTEIALGEKLKTVEAANGFGNRFLWAFSERSKLLPDGAEFSREEFAPFIEHLNYCLAFARGLSADVPLRRDEGARELWYARYESLSSPPPGIYGAMISRAAPQVLRLSMIYALLDRSWAIRRPHLEAALAVWDYCKASVEYIFGDAMGDPAGEKVLAYLSEAGPRTRGQINRAVFGGHCGPVKLVKTLDRLRRQGLVEATESARTGPNSSKRSCQLWQLRSLNSDLRLRALRAQLPEIVPNHDPKPF